MVFVRKFNPYHAAIDLISIIASKERLIMSKNIIIAAALAGASA